MKKKEMARHLDLMSDELDENPPEAVVAVSTSLDAYLPTDGEMLAMRIGIIGALIYATQALTGEVRPGDPVEDARNMMGDGISVLVSQKREADNEG